MAICSLSVRREECKGGVLPYQGRRGRMRCHECGKRQGITTIFSQQGGGNYCKTCYPVVTQNLLAEVSAFEGLQEFYRIRGAERMGRETGALITKDKTYIGDLSFSNYGIFYIVGGAYSLPYPGIPLGVAGVIAQSVRMNKAGRNYARQSQTSGLVSLHQELAQARKCIIIPRPLIVSLKVLWTSDLKVQAGDVRYFLGLPRTPRGIKRDTRQFVDSYLSAVPQMIRSKVSIDGAAGTR